MISLQVALALALLVSLASASHSVDFITKYCTVDEITLHCRYVELNSSDIQAIQSHDFVLSNQKIIVFTNGNLGNINSKFFRKFPNATEMYFDQISLNLSSSGSSEGTHPLQKVTFEQCLIMGNMNTDALHSLKELRTLEMRINNPEYKYIDSKFLKNNVNLEVLKLTDSGFNNLNNNALKSLRNLKILHLYNMKITSFTWKTFENNPNLKELRASGNKLQKMPFRNTFPGSLEILDLGNNRISNLTKAKFFGLENLKVLNLKDNVLKSLDENVFDSLCDLEVLHLENNHLRGVTTRHFRHLKSLREVNLALNYLVDVQYIGFDKQVFEIFPQKV